MNVEEVITEYKELRIQNINKAHEYLLNAYNEAKGNEPDRTVGRICYYLAEISYLSNQIKNSREYCLKSIDLLKQEEPVTEYAASLNLLGAYYLTISPLIALDYYLTALDYAEQFELGTIRVNIFANVACVYGYAEQYDETLKYYSKALKLSKCLKMGENMQYAILLNIISIYYAIDDKEKFLENYQKIGEYEKDAVHDQYNAYRILVDIEKDILLKETDNISQKINKLLDMMITIPCPPDFIHDILYALKEWITLGLYDQSEKVLDMLENFNDENSHPELQAEIEDTRLLLYGKLGDEMKILRSACRYHRLRLQRKKNETTALRASIQARVHLRETEKNNERIKREVALAREQAEKDALTGLYNRSVLKSSFIDIFNKAKNDNKSIGVSIIDVDFFKQYNDYYGHPDGDDCLIKLTGLMREIQSDKVLPVRYGGDEFLMLYIGMEDKDVHKTAAALEELVEGAAICHRNRPDDKKQVTITQGIYNSVPKNGQTLNDFIKIADKALYKGKRHRSVLYMETGDSEDIR